MKKVFNLRSDSETGSVSCSLSDCCNPRFYTKTVVYVGNLLVLFMLEAVEKTFCIFLLLLVNVVMKLVESIENI